MKKLLCTVFLLLVLAFPVQTSAESIAFPASENDIIGLFEETMKPEYDYLKIWYYQPLNCICMDVAIDGTAEIISALLEQGYDETYKPWFDYKNGQITLYNAILDVFRQVGREDLNLSFSIVNDDIYIRNDDSKLSATTFLTIRNGEIWFDLLYERSMLRAIFGE